MIKLEYWNGKEWIFAGDGWIREDLAWLSLGGDDDNYRTVNEAGIVLTDKRLY